MRQRGGDRSLELGKEPGSKANNRIFVQQRPDTSRRLDTPTRRYRVGWQLCRSAALLPLSPSSSLSPVARREALLLGSQERTQESHRRPADTHAERGTRTTTRRETRDAVGVHRADRRTLRERLTSRRSVPKSRDEETSLQKRLVHRHSQEFECGRRGSRRNDSSKAARGRIHHTVSASPPPVCLRASVCLSRLVPSFVWSLAFQTRFGSPFAGARLLLPAPLHSVAAELDCDLLVQCVGCPPLAPALSRSRLPTLAPCRSGSLSAFSCSSVRWSPACATHSETPCSLRSHDELRRSHRPHQPQRSRPPARRCWVHCASSLRCHRTSAEAAHAS